MGAGGTTQTYLAPRVRVYGAPTMALSLPIAGLFALPGDEITRTYRGGSGAGVDADLAGLEPATIRLTGGRSAN